MRYVAFIRGINVGTKNSLPMTTLKKLLEKTGCKNVKTILASGNALFESPKTASALEKSISKVLTDEMGRGILVIVRSLASLEKLAASDPFSGIRVTPKTRLYVTFLSEKPRSKKITTNHPGYKVIKLTDTEMFSHLEITDGVHTPDLMKVIDAQLGRNTTMRNWNTIDKILKV